MEKNLTSGSVLKNLVYFSLPYLLSYFLQTLYGMADLFIIGQFEGVAGTTAVSVGSQVMHMLTVMIVGLAMGATVSIGQAVGAKDRKKAADCTGNTVTVFLVLSVILTAVLLLSVRGIVSVMYYKQTSYRFHRYKEIHQQHQLRQLDQQPDTRSSSIRFTVYIIL